MHLAVSDVLYNSYQDFPVKSDDEDDEVSDQEDHSSPPVLCGNVYDILNKIRTVVRVIRKTPVKYKDVLQPLVLGKHGKK